LQGRSPTYPTGQKLKALLFRRSLGLRFLTRIAAAVGDPLGRVACGLPLGGRTPSHDVLTDFFHLLEERVEDVFALVVALLVRLGIVDDRVRVADSAAVYGYKNDSDAAWNFDPYRDRRYRGYGLLVTCDPHSHAVVAAKLTRGRNATRALALEVMGQDQERCPSRAWVADMEFDTIALVESLLARGVLPPYPGTGGASGGPGCAGIGCRNGCPGGPGS